MSGLAQFSDEDATRTIVRALRLLGLVVAVGAPVLWWKLGWQTAALFLAGAAISAASLWKWLRLLVVALPRMVLVEGDGGGSAGAPGPGELAQSEAGPGAGVVRPMAPVLVGFFVTLGLSVVVLYVSLKCLDGSVYALAAGLALGVFALFVEALRMVKTWTV